VWNGGGASRSAPQGIGFREAQQYDLLLLACSIMYGQRASLMDILAAGALAVLAAAALAAA
jgi:hypothetical protein